MTSKERRIRELGMKSRSNLKAAYHLFRLGFYDEACTLAHDATEKGLKALLTKHDVHFDNYEIKHDLQKLLTLAIQVEPTYATMEQQVALMDAHYMPSRYPSPSAQITMELAKRDIETANTICAPAHKILKLDEIER